MFDELKEFWVVLEKMNHHERRAIYHLERITETIEYGLNYKSNGYNIVGAFKGKRGFFEANAYIEKLRELKRYDENVV